MKKQIKRFFITIAAIIILLVAVIIAVFSLIKPVNTVENSEEIKFEIPYGTSTLKIAYLLKDNNLIKNEKLFYYFVRFPKLLKFCYPDEEYDFSTDANIELKSGTYTLNNSMNYVELLNQLTNGQIEYIKVSIPEGLTITQIAKLLQESNVCSEEDFINAAHDIELLSDYELDEESFEGYLFPDTYFLNSGMEASSVVKIMTDTFFEKISEIIDVNSISKGDLHDIVTLASIVEREYRIPEEAPLIASVFKNRLRQNIGLYSCATIVYILTEIEGRPHPDRVLIEDTKIDNPYNTYKWAGLTPGPISNPGMVALEACVNTPKTSYYFFQIVDPSEGKHVFTSTFDEHKVNHNLYTKH